MHIYIPDQVQCIPFGKQGDYLWITTADFIFYVDHLQYVIPKGFVTDFYSIPRIFWSWRPPRIGFGDEAALIHDFLCRFHYQFTLNRRDADKIFLACMRYYNLNAARIKYEFVRGYTRFVLSGGDGKPPKKESRAMLAANMVWQDYRDKVILINGLDSF